MIRVNLLPIKQDRRREAVRNQLLIGVGVLAIEIAVFVIIYLNISAAVATQRNANKSIVAEVDRIEKQIKDHPAILAEIAEYEKRQAAINGLQEARSGPVFVMLELSKILSKEGRPHIDNVKYQELVQLDPTAGFDENWDYRRLWIHSFSEVSRDMKISGQALTHEDVAEFLRRINLSQFFVENELVSTDLAPPMVVSGKKGGQQLSGKTVEPVVHFELKGRLVYQ